MDTKQTPEGQLLAAISLSKGNVIDFIRAKGVNVPIVISPTSVKSFIEKFAVHWQINMTKMPRNLVANCVRVATVRAEEAIKAMIPGDLADDAKLPRYLADNCIRAAAEAAEKAISPWILSELKHVNPRRQEAGKASANLLLILSTWKETVGVRTIPPTETRKEWVCCEVGLVLDNDTQFKAALAQNILATGTSELIACKVYAETNDIGWPEQLNAKLDAAE